MGEVCSQRRHPASVPALSGHSVPPGSTRWESGPTSLAKWQLQGLGGLAEQHSDPQSTGHHGGARLPLLCPSLLARAFFWHRLWPQTGAIDPPLTCASLPDAAAPHAVGTAESPQASLLDTRQAGPAPPPSGPPREPGLLATWEERQGQGKPGKDKSKCYGKAQLSTNRKHLLPRVSCPSWVLGFPKGNCCF